MPLLLIVNSTVPVCQSLYKKVDEASYLALPRFFTVDSVIHVGTEYSVSSNVRFCYADDKLLTSVCMTLNVYSTNILTILSI